MNVPTVYATADDMIDLLTFVYTQEPLLRNYGAIKIIPPTELNNVLKVKRTNLIRISSFQKVTPFNQDSSIYSIDTIPCFKHEKIALTSCINELAFWQLLSHSHNQHRGSSVSIIHNKSFFRKRIYRTGFDIHLLPQRSLLKLCDKQLLSQFVPSLTRAHGSGAIIPLASARQRLHSFHYHYEGGDRYWYIIPASERKSLECVLQQEKTSCCLDHGHALIDPIMLDKYKIRYHRLVQQANEIVILAAGTLSQSFTQAACWSESIEFALPSWLDDGHANIQLSCNCTRNVTSLSELIDVRLFHRVAIEQYINNHLNTIKYNKSEPNTDGQQLVTPEFFISSDDSFKFKDQSSNETYNLPFSNISSFEPEDISDNEHRNVLNISLNNTFPSVLNDSATLTTSHLNEMSFELLDDLFGFSSSEDLSARPTKLCNNQPYHFSFQEIVDFLSSSPNAVTSEDIDIEKELSDQAEISSYSSFSHCKSRKKSRRNWYGQKNKHRKMISNTLFISNMSPEVTKADIHRYFIGCTKVTIKQSYLSPCLNYAFVEHATKMQAESNRNQSLDSLLFGSACCIEDARENSHFFYKHQNFEGWNIVVTRVPSNVTESDLQNLFVGCQDMKYIPARSAFYRKPKVTLKTKNRVLWGYAFLYYADINEAVEIVRNVDRFQINGQPLMISFFDSMKTKPRREKYM